MELDAESVEAEVDEYNRELYKIQKVFNLRLKKMQMEIEDRNREKKKRRRHDEDLGNPIKEEDKDEELHPPQAVKVCSGTMDSMHDFKVC